MATARFSVKQSSDVFSASLFSPWIEFCFARRSFCSFASCYKMSTDQQGQAQVSNQFTE